MLCCYILHHETWYGTDSGVRVLRLIRHMKTSNLQSGLMALQGLKSVAEQLWRHRDKHAAQLADRLTLRKVIQTDDESLELVVAIRYVSPLQAHASCSAIRISTPASPAPRTHHTGMAHKPSSLCLAHCLNVHVRPVTLLVNALPGECQEPSPCATPPLRPWGCAFGLDALPGWP